MKKIAVGWAVFFGGPVVFALWDWLWAWVHHAPASALHCMEPRTWVLLLALLASTVWASAALRGGWGLLLRLLLVLGQLWVALVLQFFIVEPIQAEVGFYSGQVCGDL